MSKVSIVIPTFNYSRYLLNTINTALGQTYKNREIIVVDDGSTDDSKKVLEPFIKNKKVKYFYQKNQGPAIARRNGLFKAEGKYLTFWDADDEWSKTFLEEMVNHLEQNKLDWVVCDNYRKVLELGGEVEECKYIARSEVFEQSKNLFFEFLKNDYIGSPSKVLGKTECFKKAGIGGENFGIREDWDMWIRMTKCNFKVAVLRKPLNSYMIRKDNSNWTRRAKKNKWVYDTYNLLMHYRNEYQKNATLRRAYADLMWDLARILFYAKQDYPFVLRCALQSQIMDKSLERIFKSFLSVIQKKRFRINECAANRR